MEAMAEQAKCNQEAIDMMLQLLDSNMKDSLNLICGNIDEDSDQCDKIVKEIPQRDEKTSKRPKSPIIPIIKILLSI